MASQGTDFAVRIQSVGTKRRSLKRWGLAAAAPALLLALAFALLAQVTPARAATLTVCASGGTYASIQAAVDAAAAGDVIQICDGTYEESVELPTGVGDITLAGEVDATVVISPGKGSAIFSTGAQHLGDVTLINLVTRSPKSIVVDFTNGIAGSLVISGSSVLDGGLYGLYAGGVTGQVWITNTLFEGNENAGASILGERLIADCANPGNIPLAISLYGVEASGNGNEGVNAGTQCGSIVVVNSTADDNAWDGFLLTTDDTNSGVFITGSSADENGDPPLGSGSGFHINTNYLTMHDASATGNATDGVKRVTESTGLPSVQYSSPKAAPAGPTGCTSICGPSLPWSVEISNTSAYSNRNHGINVGTVDIVTITHVSAVANGVDGIRLPYAAQIGSRPAAASVLGMTGYITGVLAMRNAVGIEFNDNPLQPIPAGQQSVMDAVADASGTAAGSIICENTAAGLAATGTVSQTHDARFNYWGSFSGPGHITKNPTGAGDTVVDSASPGTFEANGDIVLEPWVDGASSASIPAVGVVGQTQVVSVVFKAGQAAALAPGPGNPNEGPPFTVTTDNGVLTSTFGSGSHIGAAIGADQALTVTLVPSVGGTANITVTGPCGLGTNWAVPVVAPSISVTKSVGLDPNVCAPVGGITATSGAHVYYCLTVTNSGNVTLTNHLVSDPPLGIANVPVTYALAPGASVAITHSLVSGLGPITVTNTITNAAAITSTALLTEFGGIAVAPQMQVAAQAAGVVGVKVTPTGLEPIAEPIGDKRLFLPALGK